MIVTEAVTYSRHSCPFSTMVLNIKSDEADRLAR